MRIWVFGGTGLLGRHVAAQARAAGHGVFAPTHQACPIENIWSVQSLLIETRQRAGVPEAIINCAGQVPPAGPERFIMANALGPHNLASLGIRLVHMSTDCVFSGRATTPYLASELPDATDLYGRSKLLGEPEGPHVLVVRGSFIGPEKGFLAWLLRARGRVDAWVNARWSGTSVRQMAECLLALATESDQVGIVHASARQPVTKAWMIEYLADALGLRVDINLVREPWIYRALVPDLELAPIQAMLDELVEEILDTSGDNGLHPSRALGGAPPVSG